jgi:hypothetical protein
VSVTGLGDGDGVGDGVGVGRGVGEGEAEGLADGLAGALAATPGEADPAAPSGGGVAELEHATTRRLRATTPASGRRTDIGQIPFAIGPDRRQVGECPRRDVRTGYAAGSWSNEPLRTGATTPI